MSGQGSDTEEHPKNGDEKVTSRSDTDTGTDEEDTDSTTTDSESEPSDTDSSTEDSDGTTTDSDEESGDDGDSPEESEDDTENPGKTGHVSMETTRESEVSVALNPPTPTEQLGGQDTDEENDGTDADDEGEDEGEGEDLDDVNEDDVLDLPVPDKEPVKKDEKEETLPIYKSGPLILGPRRQKLWLTKYERARIIGTRATQLVGGMPDRLKPEEREQVQGPIARAKLELLQRETPFIIRRTLPNGTEELVPVQEML